MSTSLIPVVDALLPLLRQFVRGDYGIALGGAHAKGAADPQSDLDLYLFARQILPEAERKRLCQQFPARLESVTCWGADDPFVQAGTDFYLNGLKVECWLRNIDYISSIIEECQAGVVKRELVTWTVTGFYNHCALSDLHHMIPVDDPAGILEGWQAAVRVYPAPLRKSILNTHMQAARFWRGNFHYHSAVQRGDVIYVMSIVHQVIHNLIQVLFALNRAYFPGDKKLHAALERLEKQPANFSARIERLMLPGAGTPDTLTRQRDELYAVLDEVEALLASDE
jgi:hypothetical protein